MQEGHRLEPAEGGGLSRSGVVYNEMRGDYASADSLTSTASIESLFDDGHPYSFDSGGEPDLIPDLDYEAFVDFWAENYRPGNCRIFLYGNLDTTRQLAFLDERFLSRKNPRWKAATGPRPDVPVMPLRAEPPPRRAALPSRGRLGRHDEHRAQLAPPPHLRDPDDLMAAELLAELLVGHDGAPLAPGPCATRASGTTSRPQTGFDTNFRQPHLQPGAQGHRGRPRGRDRGPCRLDPFGLRLYGTRRRGARRCLPTR